MTAPLKIDAALRDLGALDPHSVIRPRFRGRVWTVPVASLKRSEFCEALTNGDLASVLVLMVGLQDAQALIGTARPAERFGGFVEEFVTACVAAAPAMQTGEVTGWRYWAVVPTETGVSLTSPFYCTHGSFASPITEVKTGPLLPPAICWWENTHAAPVLGCQCGWRVVRDRNELAAWMFSRALWQRFARLPFAIIKVSSHGRVLPWQPLIDAEAWSDEIGDPTTTYRAERIEIIGPAILSPTVPKAIPDVTEHLRRQFGCHTEPVLDERPQEFLARLASGGTG